MEEKVNHNEKSYEGLVKEIRNPGVFFGSTIQDTQIVIKNTVFENFSNEFSEFHNSFFRKSLFYYELFKNNLDISTYGFYTIENSIFNNIYGGYGSIVGIYNDSNLYKFHFKNCTFTNNYSIFGGVAYSINDSSQEKVKFDNCIFENNTSEFGKMFIIQ
ncbi:hypothetical protein PIROE2DRAFT_14565 [Piromyces sp. E2]|nr:hypothetical protein PIROE2DRAFT_14565 [Piromyces sp. E2]|eukprot:OUM59825.1 hypothetical protein PIROE2DRAFT_14565 [Piromyces sp. E2]